MKAVRIDIIPIKGLLWHYGHFIHDFIMPVILYINESNPRLTHIFIIQKTYQHEHKAYATCLGTLHAIAEKILGIKIMYTAAGDLTTMPVITLKSEVFGPYTEASFKHIIPHITRTIRLPKPSVYKVILIERSVRPLINGSTDTGANRRHLSNHEELKTLLQTRFADTFTNVVLEDLTIEQQIGLFMNAQLVIGQHGAGLCNIIWLTHPNSTIIEFPPFRVDTFANMCKALNYKYFRIDNTASELEKTLDAVTLV
jgi:hypothetical protein